MEEKDTLTDRIKDYGFAGLFYLAGKTVDSLATLYNVNREGTSAEGNPIVKYFMDSLGVEAGLLTKSAIEIGIVLPVSYRGRKVLAMSSKSFLYFLGVVHLFGAATHLPAIIKDYIWY